MTATTPAEGESYTIRRKVFRMFGGALHVYGKSGAVVAFCEQKRFRLKEDIRLYTDESKSAELFVMRTQKVLDIAANFEVVAPDGTVLGVLRRKGLKSMLRDEWLILPPGAGKDTTPLAFIREDSVMKAVLRRVHDIAGMVLPQSYHVTTPEGAPVAEYRQHFNPFVFRMGVRIEQAGGEGDTQIGETLLLAAGCLLALIEGRQG